MMLGISLDPCFILFGADEEVYPAPIFKMSRRAKEEPFIISLLFLLLSGRAWGRGGGPPPPCVSLKRSTITDDHRRKLPSRLPVPAAAALRTHSQQEAVDAQSSPWAPCPVCAH